MRSFGCTKKIEKNQLQIILTVLVIFCWGFDGRGQDSPDSKTTDSLSTSIVSYPDDVILRLGASNEFTAFKLTDNELGSDVTLSPNQQIKTSFSLLFRYLSVSLSFTPKFLKFNDDDDKKGKTEFFNLGARIYLGHWMQDFQWSATKGFYLSMPAKNLFESERILPDFKITRIGGSTAYIFNSQFSFPATNQQNEWQKVSSGSFVPRAQYFYTEAKHGDGEKDKYFDVSLGPAYYYNWVIDERFLISGGVFAGIGYSNAYTPALGKGGKSFTLDAVNYQTRFKVALGYNTRHFFTGVNLNFNSSFHDLDTNYQVDDRYRYFEFHVGYRFKAPETVIKTADKIEGALGLDDL